MARSGELRDGKSAGGLFRAAAAHVSAIPLATRAAGVDLR